MSKRILIAGQTSYIASSFNEMMGEREDYIIELISVRGDQWEALDFSHYDVVINCAGIAHNATRTSDDALYFEVNRDLAIALASKAKAEGVKQYIYLSSVIVFGNNSTGKMQITKATAPSPDNAYGESKLQAEKGLEAFNDPNFHVAILRPPMVFGKGSQGNYPLLAKFAQKTPFFPDFPNKRSMIFIGNLIEVMALIIDNNEDGFFHPQNIEYVQTSKLVAMIAEAHHKSMKLIKIFNPLIRIFFSIKVIKKVFGDLYYSEDMINFPKGYREKYNLMDAIRLTEE